MRPQIITPSSSRTCEHCGVPIPSSARGKGRFCSRTCWRAFESAQTPIVACAACGQPFPISAYLLATNQPRFCSRACHNSQRTRRPLAERFWKKVNKTDTCWLWTASADTNGYGRIAVDTSQPRLATHVAWFLQTGEWPTMFLLHHCDNPPCVRFDHLFLGTAADNMADASQKRRTTYGERSVTAKLTEALALELRRRYAAGGVTQNALAKEYHLAQATVSELIRGLTWKHLL